MLSLYRNLVNEELKQILKLYKNSKFKYPTRSIKTLVKRSNLNNSHTLSNNLKLFNKFQINLNYSTRLFKDSENVYAYNILQNIPLVNKEILEVKNPNIIISTADDFNKFLEQDWRSRSATEIVNGFKSVLTYCIQNDINVSDNRFDKLVDGLADHVQDLTDAELLELLDCLIEYPLCDSYTAHNFHDVWSALDDVCCWKMHKWSNETMFAFADCWYRFNLGKCSDFVYNFIDRMQKRLKQITKNEVVHLFFYLKVHKRHKIYFEYEQAVDEFIADMSLKEISVIAMAFVRHAQKPKLQTTVTHMISKLKEDSPNADEISIRRVVEVSRKILFLAVLSAFLSLKFIILHSFNTNFCLIGKVGNYINEFVKKLSRRTEYLTKAQLIHAFFYINICRKCYVDFSFENSLKMHIHTLNADEMAVVSLGFFKSQSPIKLKFLLSPIISQTKKECRTIHEITLTALLKVLRYSSHVLLIDQLLDLLDHLVPEIDRLSNLCCVHMALLGTTLQFCHKASLEKISQKLIKHISDPNEMRLKDIERLLVPLTMFDLNPNTGTDIYESILKEIHTEERRKEVVKYVRCLPSILNLLSLRKIYSYDLMDEILCNDKIVEIFGKSPKYLSRDILSLDVCVEIECPDYKGNRLDKVFRQKATKWKVEYTPTWDQHKKLTSVDKFYLAVQDAVIQIVQGQENVHTDHILPNFVKSDIIICKDKTGNFVQPSGFENYILGDVMKAPDPNLKWYAIIPVSWNNVIKNTTTPLGLVKMKERLLKAIGYEPLLIMSSEFLNMQDKDKIEYIKNKIK